MLPNLLLNGGILFIVMRAPASREKDLRQNSRKRRKKEEKASRFRTGVIAQGNVSYAKGHFCTLVDCLEDTWMPLDAWGPKSNLQ